MFYKVWNGTTKHIRSVVFTQKKPLELANFAIFAPVTSNKKSGLHTSELDCLISNGGVTNINHVEVKLIMHSDFLAKIGDCLQLPSKPQSNIIVLAKGSSDDNDIP